MPLSAEVIGIGNCWL